MMLTVPRTHDPRRPAQPRTERQQASYRRMLRAATVLGAEQGLEQMQMADVAAQADVALGTLYRYFPSKHHLFAAVLADQVNRLHARTQPGPIDSPDDAPAAVADLLGDSVAGMLRQLPLARAMVLSAIVVRTEDEIFPNIPFTDLILDRAALASVTDDDRRLARLVEQCTYGILTWATSGEITPDEAVADVRRACLLLLAPWRRRTRTLAP